MGFQLQSFGRRVDNTVGQSTSLLLSDTHPKALCLPSWDRLSPCSMRIQETHTRRGTESLDLQALETHENPGTGLGFRVHWVPGAPVVYFPYLWLLLIKTGKCTLIIKGSLGNLGVVTCNFPRYDPYSLCPYQTPH